MQMPGFSFKKDKHKMHRNTPSYSNARSRVFHLWKTVAESLVLLSYRIPIVFCVEDLFTKIKTQIQKAEMG